MKISKLNYKRYIFGLLGVIFLSFMIFIFQKNRLWLYWREHIYAASSESVLYIIRNMHEKNPERRQLEIYGYKIYLNDYGQIYDAKQNDSGSLNCSLLFYFLIGQTKGLKVSDWSSEEAADYYWIQPEVFFGFREEQSCFYLNASWPDVQAMRSKGEIPYLYRYSGLKYDAMRGSMSAWTEATYPLFFSNLDS